MLDTVLRIDHKFNDKWAILGHYMDDQVTQGYAHAGTGLAVGKLQHHHQHPVEPVAVRGHQAVSGTINPNLLVEASINYDGNVHQHPHQLQFVSALPAGA